MATGTALATQRQPSAFEIEITAQQEQFVAALPPSIPFERFRRVMITAINRNADLAKADRRSFYTACMSAAADGLLPDGREAALVVFNGAVSYMPMIHGIRKRMRNSGEVTSANAYVIYDRDEFAYELGDNPTISHKPAPLTDNVERKPVGAYAIIRLANGEVLREVMSVPQIERARKVSRSANGPAWTQWWDEMARKTVLHRCSKAAPVASDMEDTQRREEDSYPALPVPPRPTRESLAPTEPFTVLDPAGAEREFSDPGEAAHVLITLFADARTADEVAALVESNNLIDQLRSRLYDDLADTVVTAREQAITASQPMTAGKK